MELAGPLVAFAANGRYVGAAISVEGRLLPLRCKRIRRGDAAEIALQRWLLDQVLRHRPVLVVTVRDDHGREDDAVMRAIGGIVELLTITSLELLRSDVAAKLTLPDATNATLRKLLAARHPAAVAPSADGGPRSDRDRARQPAIVAAAGVEVAMRMLS